LRGLHIIVLCSSVSATVVAPQSKIYTNPEITGLTAKGKSIKVIKKLFPKNEYFAIAQDAHIPKITFSGTAMAAVINVSFIALNTYSSLKLKKYAS
jgi:hypothetical protein